MKLSIKKVIVQQQWLSSLVHLVLSCSVAIITISLLPLIILIIARMSAGPESLLIDHLLGTAGTEVTKRQTLEFLYAMLCAVFVILILWVIARRFVAQERMVDAQYVISKQRIFNDAINHLGNLESASIRLSGIASLYDLANSKGDYQSRVCEILCSHIRAWTQRQEYQKQFKDQPSSEVQYIVNLLTQQDKNMPFRQHPIDLSNAYLVGARLTDAHLAKALLRGIQLRQALLYGANLKAAQLQEADLRAAKMTGADLTEAHLSSTYLQQAELRHADLTKAELGKAQLQGSDLYRTQLQESLLWQANLQGAYLWKANLNGAEMWKVKMQGAYCNDSNMQGVDLDQAELHGAYLSNAALQGADLNEAQLQGADLSGAQLQGAIAVDRKEIGKYHKRMEVRKDEDTEIKTAIFAGGVSSRQLKRIRSEIQTAVKEKWLKQTEATRLQAILKEHHNKPVITDYQAIAKEKNFHTGILTAEMVTKILKKDPNQVMVDMLTLIRPTS